jgi:hypothetical protein
MKAALIKRNLWAIYVGTGVTVFAVCGAYAAGKWAWKCAEKGCPKASWNGGYSSKDDANTAGKEHERATKGHRWDLKEQ